MPGKRGIARRSPTLRRIKRITEKYVVAATVRRFKVMDFQPTDPMPVELNWELEVLNVLEIWSYTTLEGLGVPTDQWNYYLGFAKRLWEREVQFDWNTAQLEKQSLLNEYTLRGLDPTVLAALQDNAELLGKVKRDKNLRFILGYEPPLFVEPWSYGDPIGLELKFSEDWNYTEPPSMALKFLEAWSS